MCGIFGMFGDKADPSLAGQVISALRHRGPDDQGVKSFENGLMAHTRLSIIDLSPLGRQPMSNAEGTAWITYNGEIYNYLELREELNRYPFRTHTDTEVILAAYEAWGVDFLSKLRGMFAFGLWDLKNRILLCATDRFSIKPLYYCRDGRRFIFSSEIKPIALSGVPLRLNPALLYDYLAFGLLDHSPETLFEGISQLRPGSFLLFQEGRLQVKNYWNLTPSSSMKEGKEGEDLPGQVEERLAHSLKLHLRGDVEVGLSLSSGLDSNLLRALILRSDRSLKRPLNCFTYSFPDTPYDEWVQAQALPADAGCLTHAAPVRPESLWEGLRRLIEVMEGPVGGLGIYGYWVNAQLASEHGIKVLLDGQGADEVFAGYRYYYDLKIRQLWERGYRREAEGEFSRLQQSHGENGKEFSSWIRSAAPSVAVLAPDSTPLTSSYLNPDFASSFLGREHEFPEPFDCAVKNAMLKDLFFLKIPKLLRFQDKCAMAWGVEVRVPYLDHELVEFLFGLPSERLLEGGLTKSLLRSVAEKYLAGEEVLRIPKRYVAAPQREWVKSALEGPIRQMIQESVLADKGYISREQLLRQFDQYVSSPELGNSFFAWKFLNLEVWYRAFLDTPVGLPYNV